MDKNKNVTVGGGIGTDDISAASDGVRPCNMGVLPGYGYLAASYVPAQAPCPVYDRQEALTRGTLFPGLDLPFMNVVNKTNPYAGTPLGEVMALEFVKQELKLYLDTHPDDDEAFAALKEIIPLSREACERYARRFGPLTVDDVEASDSYTWTKGPWPWEYSESAGGR